MSKKSTDQYKIDSHKLMYHVPRVNDWLEGKTIYPIYVEVSPSGACNHRCTFCGLDFMGYQTIYLKTDLFKERLTEMGKLGIKSIMYAGEGEPFLHKDMAELTKHTKEAGIDVSFTTNGTLLKKETLEQILGNTVWIKVSINAGTKETYSKIHRTKEQDFDKVIEYMSEAVKIRRENKYDCTLGMQMILLPENFQEATLLAKIAKDIGMDYLVIKPYSQHTQSHSKQYDTIKYEDYEYLEDELEKFNSETFKVVFRAQTMKKWDNHTHGYTNCLALPFWAHIDAEGNVWGCSVYLTHEKFCYGNLFQQSFKEIWEGEKRKQSLKWVEKEMDVRKCRINCRMDKINQYLHELKHPSVHVNFI